MLHPLQALVPQIEKQGVHGCVRLDGSVDRHGFCLIAERKKILLQLEIGGDRSGLRRVAGRALGVQPGFGRVSLRPVENDPVIFSLRANDPAGVARFQAANRRRFVRVAVYGDFLFTAAHRNGGGHGGGAGGFQGACAARKEKRNEQQRRHKQQARAAFFHGASSFNATDH